MMTVEELIITLRACPPDAVPYIGKGTGPVAGLRVKDGEDGRVYVILDPVPS